MFRSTKFGADQLAAFVVVLIGAVSLSASSAFAETEEYELDELLEHARNYAPLVAEMDANERFAHARKRRADRAWWPRLEARSTLAPVPADADPTRIDENIDEIVRFDLGPYFRQTARAILPLYTFGEISTSQELAQLGVDVAELQRQEAIQEHLQRTRQAYYGRQLSRAFGELLDEGGELIRDQLQQMEEDRAFGEADFDVEDLRRLQIFEAELDGMELDNERLRDLSESALSMLTDKEGPIQVPPLDPEQADLPLADLATYQNYAVDNRPELRQLRQGVEARRLQKRLDRSRWFPRLFLAADFQFGWSTEDPALQPVCRRLEEGGPCVDTDTLYARPYRDPFDTLNFGVALGLQWNFDLAGRIGSRNQSQAQHTRTEAQLDRALDGLRLEVENTWREASDARERIEIEKRRFDAARRWRNQYGLQEDLGRDFDDMQELLDPLRAYYQARASYLEAAHQYLSARAELARVIGADSLEDVPGSQ